MAEPRVLLTVSGRVPADLDAHVAAGLRPRADYRVIAEQCDATVVDVDVALQSGPVARVLHRVAGAGPLLAWYCFRNRKRFDVILSDGEQVGIPYALLCRVLGRGGARHVMIVHILSVPKKAKLISATKIAGLIDRYVVYCSAQRDFIRERFGVPGERIELSPFMVDTRFFAPVDAPTDRRAIICTAGLERRDYPTLLRAVDGLDVHVVVAAASPWSRRADSTAGEAIPPNVSVRRLSLAELRDVYAASRVVVMPLDDTDFQAGITTILEGMSMGRPIVCTRTRGQTDTIIDGVTGRYVSPGDPEALRSAIVELLADPSEAATMGAAARAWAVERADIEVYAQRLAGIVRSLV